MIKIASLYKNFFLLISLAVISSSCADNDVIKMGEYNQPISNNSKTQTGFYWPTGTVPNENSDNWLAQGCDIQGNYAQGEYHIGRDIPAKIGEDVFAISDGEVVLISKNGWGVDNVAILISHKLANGDSFIAVYGHIQTNLRKGDWVKGGMPFATIGDWAKGIHLHFGVRPGESLIDPFGKMPCPYSGDTNGFVDPIDWITIYSPKNTTIISSVEIKKPTESIATPSVSEYHPSQSESDIPNDIPIPSDAYNFYYMFGSPFTSINRYDANCSQFEFSTNISPSELIDFYLQEMKKLNWHLVSQEGLPNYYSNFYFEKNNRRTGIFIDPDPIEPTRVYINFSDWFYSTTCRKIPEDIPFPPELRKFFDISYWYYRPDPNDSDTVFKHTKISFYTIYPTQEVANFYLENLTRDGWELECNNNEQWIIYMQFMKQNRKPPWPDLADSNRVYITITDNYSEVSISHVKLEFYLPGLFGEVWQNDSTCNPSP